MIIPNMPLGELTEAQVQKIIEVSTDTLRIGAFNTEKFLEFAEILSDYDKEIILTVTNRDDTFMKGGCIIAEIQSTPKRYIALAGMRDE